MNEFRTAVTRYRTLVLEGREGLDREGPLAALAGAGFLVRRMAAVTLPPMDPTRPYRELLAGAGRLAVDGGVVGELVYGPLRRGRSRVTWIQALDFAEAVAERDGALVHVTPPPGRCGVRHGDAGCGRKAATTEADEARLAYERAFGTLAQHVPIVTVHTVESVRQDGPPGTDRDPTSARCCPPSAAPLSATTPFAVAGQQPAG